MQPLNDLQSKKKTIESNFLLPVWAYGPEEKNYLVFKTCGSLESEFCT
jgi:hypothetical protein